MKLQLTPKKQAILEELGISLFLKKSPIKTLQPRALPTLASTRRASDSLNPLPIHQTVGEPRHPLPNGIIAISANETSLKNEKNSSSSKAIKSLDWERVQHELASQVQGMNGSMLESHLQSCQSCELGTHTPLRYIEPLAFTCMAQSAETSATIDWLMVADAPKRALDGSVMAFSENSQSLLDAVLKHLGSRPKTAETEGVRHVTHHITHTVKCLGPGQQIPSDVATQTCLIHLKQQIKLLQPKLLLVMGLAAAHALLKDTPLNNEPLGRLRSKVHRFENTPMIVTYAPEQMLRSGETKSNAWTDFCLAHSLTH